MQLSAIYLSSHIQTVIFCIPSYVSPIEYLWNLQFVDAWNDSFDFLPINQLSFSLGCRGSLQIENELDFALCYLMDKLLSC